MVDRFLSQRHNVTPIALVDTMEESEKMDHCCDDSSDDDQSLGMQQESKSSLLNFTSYLSHNVTCLNFFGSWQSNWQVWERFNTDSQMSDMWVWRKHLFWRHTHYWRWFSNGVCWTGWICLSKLWPKYCQWKITILLVRDFTNVVLPVSNNLIDRQPYGFYNIQYLIIDIHPRCNCRWDMPKNGWIFKTFSGRTMPWRSM